MVNWRDRLLEDDDAIRRVLESTRRIAVLGIKPESRSQQPAYYVPAYLKRVGYEIVPVPVYYPEVEAILDEPVYRRLVDVPGKVDMVLVFRKSSDVPDHVDDILAASPAAVWLQLGIRNDDAAREWATSDIQVVQDRCSMVEHRRLLG